MKIQLPSNLTGAIQSADYRKLDDGKIWFGQADKDPRSYPIDTFLDKAMTIPAPPYFWLKMGYVSHNGNVVDVYVADDVGEVSILITDVYGRQLMYLPSQSVAVVCDVPDDSQNDKDNECACDCGAMGILPPVAVQIVVAEPIEPSKNDTPTDDGTPPNDNIPPVDDTPPTNDDTPPDDDNANTGGGINSIYNTDEPSEYHYIDNLNYLMINANDYTYTRNGRNNLSKIDEQDALWQLKNWDKLRKIKVLDSNSFNQKEPDMQKKISSFYPDVFYDDLFVYHRANADDSVQSIFDGVIIEPFFATTSDEVIDYINITLRNKLMEFLPFVDVEKLREYEDINTGNQYEKISIQFDGVRIAVLNRDYNNNPKSDNGEPNYNAVSNYYDYKTSYEYIQSKFPPGSKYDGYPIDGKLTTSQKSSFKKDDERVFNYIRELIDGYSKELTDNNRKRVRQIVDKRTGDPSTKENKIVAFDVTLTLMFHATLVKTVYYPAEGYDESMVFDFTLEQYVNDVVGVNFMFTFNQLEHGYYSNEKLIDLITYKSHLSK